MPLDPIIEVVLNQYMQAEPVDFSSRTPEKARADFRLLTTSVRAIAPAIEVAEVRNITVPGEAGQIPARVYVPLNRTGPCPTVIFFHGGGHMMGDLDTHDNQARTICVQTNSVVVSVEYRLAPEHQWPAGPNDALAAANYIYDHVDEFGGDQSAIGVAGDSAGGNLSAVTAMRMAAAGRQLKAAMLIYPDVDFSLRADYKSRFAYADGYFLTLEGMQWFARLYVPEGTDITHPDLSPIYGPLELMPPTVVLTAEFDPLHDEGAAIANALAGSGVQVHHVEAPGMIHGFFDVGAFVPAAGQIIQTSTQLFASLLRAAA